MAKPAIRQKKARAIAKEARSYAVKVTRAAFNNPKLANTTPGFMNYIHRKLERRETQRIVGSVLGTLRRQFGIKNKEKLRGIQALAQGLLEIEFEIRLKTGAEQAKLKKQRQAKMAEMERTVKKAFSEGNTGKNSAKEFWRLVEEARKQIAAEKEALAKK